MTIGNISFYFTRLMLTKFVQIHDWYNIQKIPFLTLYLKQNINKQIQKFSNCKIEKTLL